MGPKFCKSRIYGNVISAQTPVKADLWNIMGPKSCKSEIYETVIWGQSLIKAEFMKFIGARSPVKAKFMKE